AVAEEQCVFGREASQGIAGDALKKRLQLRIPVRDTDKEALPYRTSATRGDRRDLRHVVVGPSPAHFAAAQVDDAARRIEQHCAASHWSTVAARRRSAFARRSTAETVFALASAVLALHLPTHSFAASRQVSRT